MGQGDDLADVGWLHRPVVGGVLVEGEMRARNPTAVLGRAGPGAFETDRWGYWGGAAFRIRNKIRNLQASSA